MLYWMSVQGKPVAADKGKESLNYPETVCTGKLVAPRYQGNPGTRGDSEDLVQCITRLCTSHGESLLDCKTNLWPKSDG